MKSSTRRGIRNTQLKIKFGITADDYDAILISQGNVCDICKRPNILATHMPVDHDHTTGKVRGILCNSCNHMLGKAGDNPSTLRAAADYLEKHEL